MASNHFMYQKLDLAPRYDVTFVGQPHGNRRQIIEALRRAGVDVHVWGQDGSPADLRKRTSFASSTRVGSTSI